MGAALAGESAPPFDVLTLSTWQLKHCTLMHKKYISDNFDFGITKPDFKTLMESVVPERDESTQNLIDQLSLELWEIMDPKSAGMVATLEVLCYVVIASAAELEKKIDFVFTLFDFNHGGDISYDEMVILMSSVLSAMVRYNNNLLKINTELPDDQEMEKYTDEAFLEADANQNGTIHKQEFIDWVKEKVKEFDGQPTAADMLLTFGLATRTTADDMEMEDGGDGDQSSAPDVLKGSNDPWLKVAVEGVGEVGVEYDLQKGMFTFSTAGVSCTGSDDGFVQNKYLRKLAQMKAKKLKLHSVKPSKNGKRSAKQELVLSQKWEDQDDLSDYLQLVCLSLTEKEKALRARKDQLQSRVATLESSR